MSLLHDWLQFAIEVVCCVEDTGEEESLDIHIISYFAVGVIFYISPRKSLKQITFLELRKNVWIIQSKPPGISHYVSVFYAEREMKNSCAPQEKNIAGVATIIYTPWTMNMCSEFHGEVVAVQTLANDDRSPKVIISIWLHTIVQTKKAAREYLLLFAPTPSKATCKVNVCEMCTKVTAI